MGSNGTHRSYRCQCSDRDLLYSASIPRDHRSFLVILVFLLTSSFGTVCSVLIRGGYLCCRSAIICPFCSWSTELVSSGRVIRDSQSGLTQRDYPSGPRSIHFCSAGGL